MIVTQPKPWSEVAELLKGRKQLFLVGCGECATLCQTGGEKEVAALREQLARDGFTVTGDVIIGAPCDERQTKRDLAAANPINAAMGTTNGGTLQLAGLKATANGKPT